MGENQGVVSPSYTDEISVRSYQQEMLEASLIENIIVAQDTGSGKTHIAVLRIRIECDRELHKVSWFLAPTVALCEQQRDVISKSVAGSVGLIHGGLEPKQWTDPKIWKSVLEKNRVVVSTPQVLLDALSHGYVSLGRDITLLVFDEAHHANDNHPMNRIMMDFYFSLPRRKSTATASHGVLREERPMILGLTASPMFGGNAAIAFRTLERNLDCVIRSPQRHHDELVNYVHRPTFRHVLYTRSEPYETCRLASPNLQALWQVVMSMDIEQDPYVLALREELRKAPAGPERHRVDQKLSKVISKRNSFTHKGLRGLLDTAHDLCWDLGQWAADWYIERVVTMALESASPYSQIFTSWQLREKAYLIEHLKKIDLTPTSYELSSFDSRLSEKVRVLISTLMEEKARSENLNEPYSGLLFVTRRDAVLALSEILEHHPRMRGVFRVGCLVGSSESAYRTAFLDITRKMLKDSQSSTLADFRSGDKNLVVATSVAEEGLDIQACGNVIRWDVPDNMASWAQSRGRARKKRSSFVLMFESGGIDDARIAQFETLEKQMTTLYNAQRQKTEIETCDTGPDPADDEIGVFRVESTGALLTLQAAIGHLNHFCSLLSKSQHKGHQPLYDIDPPDMPKGWHSLDPEDRTVMPYQGPFGCTLTLPRLISAELRLHTVEQMHQSKRSAHQQVAFNAYIALYKAGLLNDHLLPLISVDAEAGLEEEVKKLLKDIEKRSGMSAVASQLNPWQPRDSQGAWWYAEITIDGLPPLELLTQVPITVPLEDNALFLHHPLKGKLRVTISPSQSIRIAPEAVQAARLYTRRLFWNRHGARMTWQHLDFAYLFVCSHDPENSIWEERREWAKKQNGDVDSEKVLLANADLFGKVYNYPTHITWIRDGGSLNQPFRFVGWHFEKLSAEEEEELRAFPRYSWMEDPEVTYPLLIAEPLPSKANLLLPRLSEAVAKRSKQLFFLPKYSYVDLLSSAESEYSILVPSILRHLTVVMTVQSLRQTLFEREPKLASIPTPLLTEAITAPAASDLVNYQRLETLGDAVLKFIVAVNLMAQHPLWHEGYLTRRKDHTVNNSRLAKVAIKVKLYQWIIRNRFTPRKYTPLYLVYPEGLTLEDVLSNEEPVVEDGKPRSDIEQLSTKMMADVVESLIGAAYLHGGFDLSIRCIQHLRLGLQVYKLQECIDKMVNRVEFTNEVSNQLVLVELMIGYTFQRKLLLVEALSHASSQYDAQTVSYERMEFLGDALLDMIVIDYLYRADKRNYGPGDMHILKAAVVNTHFLAYCCLQLCLEVDASMPGPGTGHRITVQHKTGLIRFFQCLWHSSPSMLEEQNVTNARFEKNSAEIEAALRVGKYYPWGALTRLQAPKFLSDMVESLIGAVYLDSHGNIETVTTLLRSLGILESLERIVRDNVDVLHPVSRLGIWASKQLKEVDYNFTEEKGSVICTVTVEGLEPVQAEAEKRGHASRDEARFAVAEKAIALWEIGDVSNKPRS